MNSGRRYGRDKVLTRLNYPSVDVTQVENQTVFLKEAVWDSEEIFLR